MRKFVPAAILAALALAVFAAPSSARYELHFSVLDETTKEREIPGGFEFRGKLYSPVDPSNHVGEEKVRCRENRSNRKLKCRAVFFLNGEWGGFGELYVNGNIGRDDDRLNVVGGSGDFAGVAGKMTLQNRGFTFSLVG